jgi:mono/diheme cytochrome c family protein
MSFPAKHSENIIFALRVILLGAVLAAAFGTMYAQGKKDQKAPARQPSAASGKETFLKYCASCHGESGKGNGPAAAAMKDPLPDLTTLTRHEGKYPAGYVSAVQKFGKSMTAHGSEDMPVWGSRFKTLDPVHDPTAQHVDGVVAFLESLQEK